MSDIRFNQWLHQSGTGGVSQVASGAVGVGTTNPLADFYVRGDAQITGILTAGHIAMGSSITFGDDDRAYFGDGTDLQIYHSGSHSFIQDTGTGDLKIRSSNVRIEDTSGNLIINASPTTAFLYSSGNAKLGTAGWGAQVNGIFKVLDATDSSGSTNKLSIGTGNDFNLFHDSSHSYISNTTGHLTIQNNVAGHVINLQPKAGANGVITRYEGASELYYNGNKKFETTNTGGTVTGSLLTTGNISINNVAPKIFLTDSDTDSDFAIRNMHGVFGIHDSTNSVDRLTITSNGYIKVAGDQGAQDYWGQLYNRAAGFSFHAADGSVQRNFTFYSGASTSTERLRITSAGGVGINTTNPENHLLEIYTAAAADWKFRIHTNVSDGAGFYQRANGDFEMVLRDASNNNNYIVGSGGTLQFATSGGERMRITSTGNLLLGTSTAAISAGKGLMIADAAGARIKLCDSDQGVTASDGFEIIQSNGGNAFIYNRENSPIIFGTNNTERMRITHEGSVGIGTDGSTYELEVHDGTGAAALRMKDGANNVICDLIANSNGGLLRTTYNHPLVFHTNQVERLRITSAGRVGINETSPDADLHITSLNPGIVLEDSTNSSQHGQAIIEQNGDNLKIRQDAGNASSGTGSNISLQVDAFERLKIASSGALTNTTNSSHSQGAGTFNIKGVINQYSQGSGSGLIFDCDFGRLTGYSDDSNVSNGTNLSGVLYHATTDWASSSSNTPISVNNGTFQYRVGFGGYMEGISNGGRVSVAAGSGSPNMASTLNTASMTIETWCWYGNGGREVLVSRWGSGFPNQFNMICDPDGQFHYNSGGVGAGSGNISGEHFPAKTWHHHVWQYDSGNNVNRWYINGAFANSRSHGSSLAVSSSTGFGIFSRGDDYERWRGKIAIVRIYNRALSATEIKNHFELERGRFGV